MCGATEPREVWCVVLQNLEFAIGQKTMSIDSLSTRQL